MLLVITISSIMGHKLMWPCRLLAIGMTIILVPYYVVKPLQLLLRRGTHKSNHSKKQSRSTIGDI